MPHVERPLPCARSLRCAHRSRWAVAAVVALSVLLGGCGSLRLHSDAREKQGQAARKAWSEVDLKAFFEAERANQATLLDAEVAANARAAAVDRETAIRLLSEKSVEELADHYDDALRVLVMSGSAPIRDADRGAVEAALKSARKHLTDERNATRDFEREMSILQSMGVPKFTCAQLTAADPKILNDWKANNQVLARKEHSALRAATEQCDKLNGAQNGYVEALRSLPGGAIKQRVNDWDAAQTKLKAKQQEVDEARAAYVAALKVYDDEVATAKAGKSTVENAKEFAEKIGTALDTFQKAGDAFGAKIASEERIQLINDLLASLKTGEPLDAANASKVKIAISMFPNIVDDLRAIEQAKKGRGAVPLLMQRDIEQARLNSANVQVARQLQEIVIRSAMLEGSVQKAATLVQARSWVVQFMESSDAKQVVETVKGANPPKIPVMHNVWVSLTPDDRKRLLQSTTLYLDAVSRQDVQIKAMNKKLLALPIEKSVDLAEVNASMWTTLIGATVGQAAEFSALGIKVEDIEKILGLLGIWYIGYGVH